MSEFVLAALLTALAVLGVVCLAIAASIAFGGSASRGPTVDDIAARLDDEKPR